MYFLKSQNKRKIQKIRYKLFHKTRLYYKKKLTPNLLTQEEIKKKIFYIGFFVSPKLSGFNKLVSKKISKFSFIQ